jgi:beta-xylosidase
MFLPTALLGAPHGSDFDVFLEAENIASTNRFIPEGLPRAVDCSGNGWLNLWSADSPGPEGYFARYDFKVNESGKYWLLVWAQGLDTKISSPFWATIDQQKLHFTPRSAKIPEFQFRYSQGMTLHYLGPISLKEGNHTLTLTVNERRAYKAKSEKQGAYNLIVDAMALTNVDPGKTVVEKPVDISVDVKKSEGPFVQLMDMSEGGIGEVSDPNFWSAIAPMLKKIGIREIRIDHMWDYYGIVSRGTDGQLKYDWQRFDRVLDQIKAAGARPFFSVSYLPGPLSKDGRAYGVPNDFNAWKTICAELARHMTQERNLPGLSYELWNEPDGSGFWNGTQEDYYKLYSSTCEGILSVDPTAKMGGPATALGGWIEGFVKFVHEKKLRLDFVSWHWYNCTFDVNVYAGQIDRVREILKSQGYTDKVETFFTEWNFNGDFVPQNDAFYNAGNAAATLAVFHEKKLSRSFFYMPKDPNAGKELTGWFGAITHTNKPKPVYNFFDAYSRLKGRKLMVKTSDPRIGAFAAEEKGVWRVLVWHFDGMMPFGLVRKTQLNINLPVGAYERQIWLIDRQHSNLSFNPQKPELECVGKNAVKVETSEGLQMEFDLENGGVELLEFQKK